MRTDGKLSGTASADPAAVQRTAEQALFIARCDALTKLAFACGAREVGISEERTKKGAAVLKMQMRRTLHPSARKQLNVASSRGARTQTAARRPQTSRSKPARRATPKSGAASDKPRPRPGGDEPALAGTRVCAARGCDVVFVPRRGGKPQTFHAPRCGDAERQRRLRERGGLVVVVRATGFTVDELAARYPCVDDWPEWLGELAARGCVERDRDGRYRASRRWERELSELRVEQVAA